MTAYNVTTSFDTATRVLTATRGKKVLSKKMSGVVIARDHGALAGDLIKSAGGSLPFRWTADLSEDAVKPTDNGFKFHVSLDKP
jgi:hypothetical protein